MLSIVIPVAAAVTAAGMIATPLARPRGRARQSLAGVVVAGLAGVTTMATSRRWGPLRAALAAGAVSSSTWLVERVGSRTGVPFGRYRYAGVLRPEVAGVPAVVPLAWFAMAVPAREVAHAALGPRSTRAGRILVGAAALTAWDLFLDPQMVGEGYWTWHRPGRYRTIPASNFAGWFLTGLGVMALLELTLPLAPAAATATTTTTATGSGDPAAVLVGTYAYMAVMETLGFAVFFRDRVVAAVGGAAMLPIATAATARLLRQRRAHAAVARA